MERKAAHNHNTQTTTIFVKNHNLCRKYFCFFCLPIGIGYANMIIAFMVSIYYNVILAWSCYYFFHSFAAELPWVGCNHAWNKDCFVYNQSNPNATGVSSSREFYTLVLFTKWPPHLHQSIRGGDGG